jgi:hypothetical protein
VIFDDSKGLWAGRKLMGGKERNLLVGHQQMGMKIFFERKFRKGNARVFGGNLFEWVLGKFGNAHKIAGRFDGF